MGGHGGGAWVGQTKSWSAASRTTGVRSTASPPGNSSAAILKSFFDDDEKKKDCRRTTVLTRPHVLRVELF